MLEGHGHAVHSIAVMPDGRQLVSAGCEAFDRDKGLCTRGEIKIWSMP